MLGKLEYARRESAPPRDRTLSLPMMGVDHSLDSEAFLKEVRLAKAQYGMYDSDFNVALVGAQGSGKSALINGLCHINDSDDGMCHLSYSIYIRENTQVPLASWVLTKVPQHLLQIPNKLGAFWVCILI